MSDLDAILRLTTFIFRERMDIPARLLFGSEPHRVVRRREKQRKRRTKAQISRAAKQKRQRLARKTRRQAL